uniref:PPM-type phosphatase domain-containing protein n=1 Tax=Entomoneis paludosa TaxID=265537 RepID=A0A7S2VDV0_9STRA
MDDNNNNKNEGDNGDADFKSHNFRKRRLSLPRHHIESDASSAVVEEEEEDGDIAAAAATAKAFQDNEVSTSPEKNGGDDEAGDKAHTFRKRRLSLTLSRVPDEQQRQYHSDDNSKDDVDIVGDLDDDETKEPPAKRFRRQATAESSSALLQEESPREPSAQVSKSRILHSVEMMTGPLAPPSPINHPVLHQQKPLPPSQLSILDDDDEQHQNGSDDGSSHLQSHSLEFSPSSSARKKKARRRQSWKKRHHHIDEEKLPFPKDIVGTYSCHGVEPIYDSDYEPEAPAEEADEDDDGGYWGEAETETAGPGDETKTDNAPEAQADGTATESAPKTAAISAKINQDRGGITFPYANSNRTALFAVYDGHGQGGELVSQFALHEIQQRLEKHKAYKTDLEKAMRETFLAVDEALKHEPIIEPYFAGTTACVALFQDDKISLANAGDSRAVMARKRDDGQWDGIDLTIDQNPDSPEEMERIVKLGGYVSPPPGPGLSARVWLDAEQTQIGLAMARSIGDHAVADVGVIADPVVSTYEVTPQDDFMILASDGVWEFLESHEAVQIVGDHLDELGATKACQALIEAAASKWHEEEGEYRDDITAIVVRVQHLWGK